MSDEAIAAKWPAEWARANDPSLRGRSKARQKLRQRYRLSLEFDAFKQSNPNARCGNCVNFERMPLDDRMHCAAESDFHGYHLAKPDGLCMKWRPA